MPDVGNDGEGSPLEGKAEGGSVGGNGDVECSSSLALSRRKKGVSIACRKPGMLMVMIYLCAPKSQLYNPASTVSNLLGKEPRVRVVLEQSFVRLVALWNEPFPNIQSCAH